MYKLFYSRHLKSCLREPCWHIHGDLQNFDLCIERAATYGMLYKPLKESLGASSLLEGYFEKHCHR